MPRIRDSFLRSCVFLYRTAEEARQGSRVGATGFVIGREHLKDEWGAALSFHLYVVTCRHVINNGATVVRTNALEGEPEILDEDLDWHVHAGGADVAMAYLGPTPLCVDEAHFKHGWISERWWARPEDLAQPDEPRWFGFGDNPHPVAPWLGSGDDCVLVGRFVGIDRAEYINPTVRFGHLASNRVEAIPYRGGSTQDCFLVEGRSISGYSGSAVFVIHPRMDRPQGVFVGEQDENAWMYFRLLGIDIGHIHVPATPTGHEDAEIVPGGLGPEVPTIPGRLHSGMMTVIPMWTITEMFDQREVIIHETEA